MCETVSKWSFASIFPSNYSIKQSYKISSSSRDFFSANQIQSASPVCSQEACFSFGLWLDLRICTNESQKKLLVRAWLACFLTRLRQISALWIFFGTRKRCVINKVRKWIYLKAATKHSSLAILFWVWRSVVFQDMQINPLSIMHIDTSLRGEDWRCGIIVVFDVGL